MALQTLWYKKKMFFCFGFIIFKGSFVSLSTEIDFAGYNYLTTFLPNFLSIYLQNSSYKHVFTSRVGSSVDPDQLAFQKPDDLDLQCFHTKIYP